MKLTDNRWGLYFHGTGGTFDAFADKYIGTSPDANSALGIFVTDDAYNAAHYAEKVCGQPRQARVLLVLVNETRNYEFESFEAFYGCDWPSGAPDHNRSYFKALNVQLATHYTAAWFTLDDDGLIGVALKSKHTVIVGSLSCAAARSVADDETLHGQPCDRRFKTRLVRRAQELGAVHST